MYVSVSWTGGQAHAFQSDIGGAVMPVRQRISAPAAPTLSPALVSACLQNGVGGLIVGGTTGEGQLMSWDEHIMLIAHTGAFTIKFPNLWLLTPCRCVTVICIGLCLHAPPCRRHPAAVNQFGRQIKVVGNTGSNSTREALHATEQVRGCGGGERVVPRWMSAVLRAPPHRTAPCPALHHRHGHGCHLPGGGCPSAGVCGGHGRRAADQPLLRQDLAGGPARTLQVRRRWVNALVWLGGAWVDVFDGGDPLTGWTAAWAVRPAVWRASIDRCARRGQHCPELRCCCCSLFAAIAAPQGGAG